MDDLTSTPGQVGGWTHAAFAAAVIIGGANFIGVRFSNRELDPFWGAGLRFGLAAILFLVIAISLRLRFPTGRLLMMTVLYGLLSFAISYALIYWALVRVNAGLAAVILAMVPLATVLLAAAHGLERVTVRAVAGSFLAIAGIVWMTIGTEEVVLPFTALITMLLAVVSIGESVVVSKRVSGNHPAMTNAVGMTAGAIALLIISAAAGDSWSLPTEPEVLWAVIYLVTVGSVGLFVLFLLVVRRWTASATSYAFVLFPVVTMLMAAVIANEPLTVQGAVGALLVMSGVWLGALSPAARRAIAAQGLGNRRVESAN